MEVKCMMQHMMERQAVKLLQNVGWVDGKPFT